MLRSLKMEISPLIIYVIGLVDKLQFVFIVLTIFGAIGSFMFFSASISDDEYESDKKMFKSWFKRVLAVTIFSLVCSVAIPSSKTLIAMYVIPPIAKSEVVNEIPDVLMDFVKSYVGDLKKDGDI